MTPGALPERRVSLEHDERVAVERAPLRIHAASIGAKLATIVVVFVAIIVALIGAVALSLQVLSGMHAYVGAEGAWSKGQKDAVYHLTRYARTHEDADHRKYREAIAFPLGDLRARLELDRPDPDLAVVERGFVAGGNAREDVPSLVFLYRWFSDVGHFAESVALWRATDPVIAELDRVAETLRAAIAAGTLMPARERQLVDRIEAINVELAPLAREFSSTLADGARWMRTRLLLAIVAVTGLLLAIGLRVSWRISRELRERLLGIEEAAIRVGAGDLRGRVAVASRDEIGALALAFNRMVEQREAAEEALRRATEFRDKVMECASNAIYALDLEGRFVLVNRRACEITGYTAEELIGRSYRMLLDPHGENVVVPRFDAVVGEAATVTNVAVDIVRKDGRIVPVVYSNAPLEKDGEVVAIVATAEDVTERRRAEEEIRRARDEAIRASQTRSEFLSSMSHEIRTPLTPILGLTGVLLDEPLAPGHRELVERIESSAASLLALIDDVLDFSKIDAGKLRIVSAPFDLVAAVRSAVELFRSAATAKGLTLERHCAAEVPQSVIGDAGRIRQVLTNLVSNAIKFTERGGVTVDVTLLDHDDRGARVRVAVTDTGIGIPQEVRGGLFERFYQAESSTQEHFGGTGLGLAISRQLVGLMGGEIGLESELGRGSTFWFVLPLPLDSERLEEAPSTAPSGQSFTGSGLPNHSR